MGGRRRRPEWETLVGPGGGPSWINPTPGHWLPPWWRIDDFAFVEAESAPPLNGLVYAEPPWGCREQRPSPSLLLELAVEQYARRHPQAVRELRDKMLASRKEREVPSDAC